MRAIGSAPALLLLLAACCQACTQDHGATIDLGDPPDLTLPGAAPDLSGDLRRDMARGVKALLVHAGNQRGAAALRERLAVLGGFSEIAVFDAGAATPDPLLLVSYDALLVYSVEAIQDPDLLGDRLVGFIGGGGGVVTALFTTLARGDSIYPNRSIGGQFRSGGYSVLLPDSGFRGRDARPMGLGKVYDAQSPLVAGLHGFSGGSDSFRPGDSRLTDQAVRIADWTDGMPLVAKKTVAGALRVDLGFFPPPDFDLTGQNWTVGGDVLVRDALLAVARHR